MDAKQATLKWTLKSDCKQFISPYVAPQHTLVYSYGKLAEVWCRWKVELNFPNLKTTKVKNPGGSTHSEFRWVYYNYFKTYETIPDMEVIYYISSEQLRKAPKEIVWRL